MALNSKQSIFHQGTSINTIIYNDRSISIIRGAASLLAEKTLSSSPDESALLSADFSNTPINTVRNEDILGRVFSAYGYASAEHRERSLIGFAGESPIVNGKYLLGSYRMFDPVLMRFHSPDNLSPFLAGNINCYSYCSGDPINNTDPSGHIKNPITSLLKRLTNKKSKPVNSSLSQSTPAINQPSEYSQSSSFNPVYENIGSDLVPSKYDLRKAKSLSSTNIAPEAPTLEHMAKYEPSAPMQVNTITGDNLKYLEKLEKLANLNFSVMREPPTHLTSPSEHRQTQQVAARFGDQYSAETTRMIFEPGYTPSAKNVRNMIRR